MTRTTDRVLTTHAGSLPRPADLLDMLTAVTSNRAALTARVRTAVAEAMERQVAVGLDIVNDAR